MNGTIVLVAIMIGIIAVGTTILLSVAFVGAGERAVVTHWSAVSLDEPPLSQGLNFKTPFQDNIVFFSVQTQKYPDREIDSDAGDIEPKGMRIASTSKDAQDVWTEVVVLYHLNGDSVTKLYKNIGVGYESTVIQPIMKQVTKNEMAQFSAEELVTKRAELKNNVLATLGQELYNLNQCKGCIIVEDIALTDIDFTEQFSKSIEAKVEATQNALKAQNDLLRIEFEADQAREIAQGKADAKAIEAQGEAKYIATINEAIQDNPDFLKWYEIARWDGAVPKVIGSEAQTFINIPME